LIKFIIYQLHLPFIMEFFQIFSILYRILMPERFRKTILRLNNGCKKLLFHSNPIKRFVFFRHIRSSIIIIIIIIIKCIRKFCMRLLLRMSFLGSSRFIIPNETSLIRIYKLAKTLSFYLKINFVFR